jgi:TldD protein
VRAVVERLLGLLPARIDYADVRFVRRRHHGVHVENEVVAQLVREESEGLGLRVLIAGQWGFAAATGSAKNDLDRLVREAVAQAGVEAGRPVRLAPAPVVRGSWTSPVEIDPFDVPLADQVDLLVAASAEMRRAGSAVVSAQASVDAYRDEKVFGSTEGSLIEQRVTETGGGLLATARSVDDVQRRSYPQSVPRAIVGERGDFANAGWEHVRRLDLVAEAPRVGAEAVALLSADPCPVTTTTLVVGSTQMAQLIHETAGHPAELDRTLGAEDSLAGGTYMRPDELGSQRFGPEHVTIVADATRPGALGSFGWDDEGVAATRTAIVEGGRIGGFLSSRTTAGEYDWSSSGAARADGWRRVPLVRMTNLVLEPGQTPFEELIGTTEAGVLIDMNRSLSIDDRRRSFRFGAEIGWEIRGGKLKRMLRNCTYEGDTLEFWAGCDAIGDAASYRQWGIPSCGKGEPLQVAHIGHGSPPARFRSVRVGAR